LIAERRPDRSAAAVGAKQRILGEVAVAVARVQVEHPGQARLRSLRRVGGIRLAEGHEHRRARPRCRTHHGRPIAGIGKARLGVRRRPEQQAVARTHPQRLDGARGDAITEGDGAGQLEYGNCPAENDG